MKGSVFDAPTQLDAAGVSRLLYRRYEQDQRQRDHMAQELRELRAAVCALTEQIQALRGTGTNLESEVRPLDLLVLRMCERKRPEVCVRMRERSPPIVSIITLVSQPWVHGVSIFMQIACTLRRNPGSARRSKAGCCHTISLLIVCNSSSRCVSFPPFEIQHSSLLVQSERYRDLDEKTKRNLITIAKRKFT